MFSIIKFFQLNAVSLGYTATSLTDFITWINTVRNPLSQDTQIKIDALSNAAYALFKGKTSFQVDQAVRMLTEMDPVSMYTGTVKDSAYPHTLTGSNTPSTAYIQEELAIWDKNVKENSPTKAKVNTLQTLA